MDPQSDPPALQLHQLHQMATKIDGLALQLHRDATATIEAGGNYSVKAAERSLLALRLIEALADELHAVARALHALDPCHPAPPPETGRTGSNPRR